MTDQNTVQAKLDNVLAGGSINASSNNTVINHFHGKDSPQGTQSKADTTPTSFKEIADRMENLLDHNIFTYEDSLASIEQKLSDFKNTPMDLSANDYATITGYLNDVHRALSHHKKPIKQLTALTDLLGQHLNLVICA